MLYKKSKICVKKAGYSQAQFAKKLDVTRISINTWEIGLIFPNHPIHSGACHIVPYFFRLLTGTAIRAEHLPGQVQQGRSGSGIPNAKLLRLQPIAPKAIGFHLASDPQGEALEIGSIPRAEGGFTVFPFPDRHIYPLRVGRFQRFPS